MLFLLNRSLFYPLSVTASSNSYIIDTALPYMQELVINNVA